MKKKGLAVAIILLFIGLALAPSINAKGIEIKDDTTEPLDVGRFRIRGFGLFPRYSGENVTLFALRLVYSMINATESETGIYSLKRITLPINNIQYVGRFNIVIYVIGGGSGNPFEAPFINADVSKPDLDISVEENAISIEFELQRIKELVQSIDLWKIIVNPDAVVDTLEEVSSILEEEDVRNYIEKSSDEDCGCEDDSSAFEWMFPMICSLLFPIWSITFLLVIIFGYPFGEFMMGIGVSLNCFWAWA